MPRLVQVARAFQDRGLRVFGLTGAPEERVRAFVSELGVSYPVLAGAGASFGAFGVRRVPKTYLVDPGGRIVASGLEEVSGALEESLGG